MAEADIEILLTGPDELEEEKDTVEEVTSDFSKEFGVDIRTKRPREWEYGTQLEDIDLIDNPRSFEELFEYGRGIEVRDASIVLSVRSMDSDWKKHPTVYVTDKPLWAEDENDLYNIYGLNKGFGDRGIVMLTSFPYGREAEIDKFPSVVYHEYGHLFGQEAEPLRPGDGFIGDGHCDSDNVMDSTSLKTVEGYREDGQLYCDDCREEIAENLENLL